MMPQFRLICLLLQHWLSPPFYLSSAADSKIDKNLKSGSARVRIARGTRPFEFSREITFFTPTTASTTSAIPGLENGVDGTATYILVWPCIVTK
jgi:hypothetical protein